MRGDVMKRSGLLLVLILFSFLAACSGKSGYHKTSMPDPKSFDGHFGDFDTNGDGHVNWEEFKAHFPHAEEKVFNAIDLNHDNVLDHDEWHAFKEAHGLKHHD